VYDHSLGTRAKLWIRAFSLGWSYLV